MRANKSFDADRHRQREARRAGYYASRGALPVRVGQLQCYEFMDIADQFMLHDENIRSGALCMYGFWFGRPMDNLHRSSSAEFDGEVLKVTFDDGETLEVWHPSNLVVERTVLKIPQASKVRWSWHDYGKLKTPDNRHHIEYIFDDGKVLSRGTTKAAKVVAITDAAVAIC